MINKKIFLSVIIICFLSNLLFGQYDEKRIMLNQAQSFESFNQFTKAQSVYKDLLVKFPQDQDIISAYFNSLIKTSSLDDAKKLVEQSKPVISDLLFTQFCIILDLKDNKLNEAKRLKNDYFKKNPGRINDYQILAQTFESNHLNDIAVEIYLQSREVSGDQNLYSLELSNNYFFSQEFPKSINESLKYLDKNRNYFFFISSRFKEILTINPQMIINIKNTCENSEIPEFIELYALGLVQTKDYQNALLMYQKLPVDRIIRFADEQFGIGNFELSLNAYQVGVQKSEDNLQKAEINFKISNIYLNTGRISESKTILNQIIADPILKDKRNYYKTSLNKTTREILANIAIMQNENEKTIISLFDDAQTYTWNNLEKKNIDYKKSFYYIMTEQYDKAFSLIKNITMNEDPGSQILSQSYYYQYLIFLMKEDNRADSMMTEYIINFPENSEINDMMFLSLFLSNIPKEGKQEFFKAYRLKNLYQRAEAISQLDSLITKTKDDELILLLADWNIESNQIEAGKRLYASKFSNPVYEEYAKYQLAIIESNPDNKQLLITDYLKTTPGSVFSPSFRKLLNRNQPLN